MVKKESLFCLEESGNLLDLVFKESFLLRELNFDMGLFDILWNLLLLEKFDKVLGFVLVVIFEIFWELLDFVLLGLILVLFLLFFDVYGFIRFLNLVFEFVNGISLFLKFFSDWIENFMDGMDLSCFGVLVFLWFKGESLLIGWNFFRDFWWRVVFFCVFWLKLDDFVWEFFFFDEKVFDFVYVGFCDSVEFVFWNDVVFGGELFWC